MKAWTVAASFNLAACIQSARARRERRKFFTPDNLFTQQSADSCLRTVSIQAVNLITGMVAGSSSTSSPLPAVSSGLLRLQIDSSIQGRVGLLACRSPFSHFNCHIRLSLRPHVPLKADRGLCRRDRGCRVRLILPHALHYIIALMRAQIEASVPYIQRTHLRPAP